MDANSSIVITTLQSKLREKEAEIIGLERRIGAVRGEITELNDAIAKLFGGNAVLPTANTNKQVEKSKNLIDYSTYNKNWSVERKMVYVIKTLNRFVHVREIAREIVKLEPGHKERYVVEQLGKRVYKSKLNGVIVGYRVGSHRNTFYGMAEWLDENQEIRSGHEYDENQLMDRNTLSTKEKNEGSGVIDLFKKVTTNVSQL